MIEQILIKKGKWFTKKNPIISNSCHLLTYLINISCENAEEAFDIKTYAILKNHYYKNLYKAVLLGLIISIIKTN